MPPPSGPELSDSERDLAALQGDWEQVGLEADGISDPPDVHTAPGAVTTFLGSQFTVRTVDGTMLLAGSFTLDASTTPKAITWIDSTGADMGRLLPASYELDSDDFVFIAADEGAPRPTVFRTLPGQTMRTFARKK